MKMATTFLIIPVFMWVENNILNNIIVYIEWSVTICLFLLLNRSASMLVDQISSSLFLYRILNKQLTHIFLKDI